MGHIGERDETVEAKHYLLKEQRIRQAIADDIPLVLASIEDFFVYHQRAGDITEVEHKAVRKAK
jgi:hypothetical protein